MDAVPLLSFPAAAFSSNALQPMAVDRVAKEWPDLLVQIRFPLPLLLLVLVHIAAARIFAPGYLAILDAEESPSEEETDWGAA